MVMELKGLPLGCYTLNIPQESIVPTSWEIFVDYRVTSKTQHDRLQLSSAQIDTRRGHIQPHKTTQKETKDPEQACQLAAQILRDRDRAQADEELGAATCHVFWICHMCINLNRYMQKSVCTLRVPTEEHSASRVAL